MTTVAQMDGWMDGWMGDFRSGLGCLLLHGWLVVRYKPGDGWQPGN
jgi:hypothetical protein